LSSIELLYSSCHMSYAVRDLAWLCSGDSSRGAPRTSGHHVPMWGMGYAFTMSVLLLWYWKSRRRPWWVPWVEKIVGTLLANCKHCWQKSLGQPRANGQNFIGPTSFANNVANGKPTLAQHMNAIWVTLKKKVSYSTILFKQ
jgi:hypothetical protein